MSITLNSVNTVEYGDEPVDKILLAVAPNKYCKVYTKKYPITYLGNLNDTGSIAVWTDVVKVDDDLFYVMSTQRVNDYYTTNFYKFIYTSVWTCVDITPGVQPASYAGMCYNTENDRLYVYWYGAKDRHSLSPLLSNADDFVSLKDAVYYYDGSAWNKATIPDSRGDSFKVVAYYKHYASEESHNLNMLGLLGFYVDTVFGNPTKAEFMFGTIYDVNNLTDSIVIGSSQSAISSKIGAIYQSNYNCFSYDVLHGRYIVFNGEGGIPNIDESRHYYQLTLNPDITKAGPYISPGVGDGEKLIVSITEEPYNPQSIRIANNELRLYYSLDKAYNVSVTLNDTYPISYTNYYWTDGQFIVTSGGDVLYVGT